MVASLAMAPSIDAARLAAAKGRFAAFFRELSVAFAEREDVLAQIALTLLAREHLLFAGPPGTAKSALAGAVVGRILDEDTGKPSLFARQLTESTVQTDVIGPIDFKTLMETGRTSHFTDEGLLGAVHAFLDEVFDGRDMLLRSTLNLLHERELKQGTSITKGRFEIAFMTTNRYVSEVLETARETLLAFVDRVAFIGFVPRGFADPSRLAEVLRFEAGGVGRAPLDAPLSVQDLDALQAAVDQVVLPDEICDGLAKLLDLLEGELAATERADPTFAPTRYLSTRTAVRSARVLRAIVVHDAIFRRPDRALRVEPDDLRLLRLHLLLSGPSPEQTTALLARERDPRERRQLGILRAEREAFERALAKLPRIRVAEAPAAPAPVTAEIASNRGGDAASAGAAVDGSKVAAARPPWVASANAAFASGETAGVVGALRDLVPMTRAAGADGELAMDLLRAGMGVLRRSVLRATLTARAVGGAKPIEVAEELSTLADATEAGPAAAQALGRWVRGHALLLLAAALPTTLDLGHANVTGWATDRDAATLLVQADTMVRALERRSETRGRMLARGVEPELRHEADAAWTRGLAIASEDVKASLDAALRTAATAALAAGERRDLRDLLVEVSAVLAELRKIDARAAAIGVTVGLRGDVVAPRLGPLLAHTFGRVEALDRAAYLAEVDRALRTLAEAELTDVIPAADWITWAAGALLRADTVAPGAGEPALTHEGYRKLRAGAPRVPNGFVLAEIAMRTAGSAGEPTAEEPMPVAASLLAGLPLSLRRHVADADRRRVERVVEFFEAFFASLDDGAEPRSPADAAERLRGLVASGFFSILLDDAALTRTSLEIDLLCDLFPEMEEIAADLRGRLDALAERARRRVLSLARARGEGAWSAALKRAAEGEPGS
ncbi:MAG: AAA family ATPase [Polyangiaceae bacterium]